jgi:hypothetical protein
MDETIRSIKTHYQNDSSQDRTTDDFSDWDCIFQQCKERHLDLRPSIERWMTQILHRDWQKGGCMISMAIIASSWNVNVAKSTTLIFSVPYNSLAI